MSDNKTILLADGGASQIAVERAIAELRSGRPALIRSENTLIMVIGVEALDAAMAARLEALQ